MIKKLTFPLTAVLLLALAGCSSPTTPIPTADAVSQGELDKLAADALETQATDLRTRYPDIVIPTVERVRWIAESDVSSVTADCMEEQGYAPTLSADGSVNYGSINPDQMEPFELASYICAAKYPVDPKYRIPLNDAQLGYLYDYYVGDLTECLEEKDFKVSDPPSRQTFVSNYYDQGGVWTPYETVRAGNAEDWAAVNKSCPQSPPGLVG